MALDALFLKALDAAVEEIKGYSEEQLDSELKKSKTSPFAITMDYLKEFKEEFELSFHTDEMVITNSFDLFFLFKDEAGLLDFPYSSLDSAINDDCYLMAA